MSLSIIVASLSILHITQYLADHIRHLLLHAILSELCWFSRHIYLFSSYWVHTELVCALQGHQNSRVLNVIGYNKVCITRPLYLTLKRNEILLVPLLRSTARVATDPPVARLELGSAWVIGGLEEYNWCELLRGMRRQLLRTSNTCSLQRSQSLATISAFVALPDIYLLQFEWLY